MFEKIFTIDLSNQNVVIPNNEIRNIYLYDFFVQSKKSLLVVTNSLYEAGKIFHALKNYTEKVLFFPMDDFLTSEALAVSPELEITRLETINEILKKEKYIVVTNLMGFLRYLPQKEIYESKTLTLKKGDILEREKILNNLLELGYKREITVNKTGEMAIRGYVIDIFPLDYQNPIRIELWDNEIDNIRSFDVNTQLTIADTPEVEIKPITEFLALSETKNQRDLPKYIPVSSIYNYLDDAYLCFINYDEIKISYEHLSEEMFEYTNSLELPKDTKYMFDLDDITTNNLLFLDEFDSSKNLKEKALRISATDLNYNGLSIEELKDKLNRSLKNYTIILCFENQTTLNKVYNILDSCNFIITNENNIFANKVNLIIKNIENGFCYDKYLVLTEKELLNKKEEKYEFKSNFKIGTKIRDISKLEIGDYVVHYKYGIGRYNGLKNLKKGDLTKEYLMVEYAGTDKLYIPVEKIDSIKKYSNSDASAPRLNKLNSSEWSKVKAKAKARAEDIAESLLKLYALREATPGYAFQKDNETQLEFEKEFPYTETSDQLKVIKEIKKDMEKPTPMDRLLCGDVGFGKTEVAFRAMFKAVLSSKQVIFLCPTTILSQQHYDNAIQRFKDFPVNIALLNRFVAPLKAKKILEGIKDGTVDIVIGTHRVLSNDVVFKDLGLLVIDEEQRFGVKHKEKIKDLKNNIDVLTLSATPIPRTLQMALSGLRNLSLIETPPVNRYPVQTYVLQENMQIIKDAIYKEVSRGGQVYILSNHIDGMRAKLDELKKYLKDIKITYAHGQMTKKELEEVMSKFINKEYDVLLCTTIIEIGIDIPSVNTIIILDADHFGLSQLYQIRGRVGRSNKIAYCYLMYDKKKILSEIATKRLKVIKEFTELGSGFAIAMRDLSIRGAGDILGSEQAGFIDAIGIEYFLEMLEHEVDKLKGNVVDEKEESDQPLLDVSTAIDEQIVADEDLKIEIHKKINTIDSKETLEKVKSEIKDRFGLVDETLNIYMYEEWFEKYARKLNITDVNQTKNSIIIALPKELYPKIDGKKLFLEVNKLGNMFRFSERHGQLLITLDIVNLKKHYIYYLIDLLNVIENCLKSA